MRTFSNQGGPQANQSKTPNQGGPQSDQGETLSNQGGSQADRREDLPVKEVLKIAGHRH